MADLAAQQLQLHGRERPNAELLNGDEAEPAAVPVARKAANDRGPPIQEGRMAHELDDHRSGIVCGDPLLHDVGPLALG
jgi:hypothetical protein